MLQSADRPVSVHIARSPVLPAFDFQSASGATIEDIIQASIEREELPQRFWWHGNVSIGDMLVERQVWHCVRPKAGMRVTLWIPPQEPISIGSAVGSLLFSAGASVAAVNLVTFGVAALVSVAYGIPLCGGRTELFR